MLLIPESARHCKRSVLDAALDLASQGLPTFPCNNLKRPTCPGGFKSATADRERLRTLWGAFPGSLVGVPTGEASGLLVLDVDSKHNEARSWWAECRSELPPTRTHRTRSGGLHLLFRHIAGVPCSVSRLAKGVDVRADGGYIVWWPAAGMPVLHDAPVAELPPWLHRALLPPPPAPPREVVPISIRGNRRALRGLIRVVATASEGERNQTLFWSSCRAAEMIAAGRLNESDARALLVEAAVRAGLPPDEATKTIKSGLRTTGGAHG
jgi:hypothetical protein